MSSIQTLLTNFIRPSPPHLRIAVTKYEICLQKNSAIHRSIFWLYSTCKSQLSAHCAFITTPEIEKRRQIIIIIKELMSTHQWAVSRYSYFSKIIPTNWLNPRILFETTGSVFHHHPRQQTKATSVISEQCITCISKTNEIKLDIGHITSDPPTPPLCPEH